MKLVIDKKEYEFTFGFGFLEGVNEKFGPAIQGVKIRTGAFNLMSSGLFAAEFTTIVDVLKIANETESPKVSRNAIADYVVDTGVRVVSEQVIEELKKSKYTKEPILEMVKNVSEEEN